MALNTILSPKIRNILAIVLLLLTFVYSYIGLAGLIVMWIWTTWKRWIKVLITIIITIPFIILIMSSLGLLTYVSFFRPFQMSGESMTPTYKNGANLFTNVYNPQTTLNKGDIIIFKSPKNPTQDFIKRVIGLPGETVMIQNGDVYLNGQKLDESGYIATNVKTYTGEGLFTQEGIPVTVPDGQYFVLGDNRNYSSDSREWGFVPKESIISKVAFCYQNCK